MSIEMTKTASPSLRLDTLNSRAFPAPAPSAPAGAGASAPLLETFSKSSGRGPGSCRELMELCRQAGATSPSPVTGEAGAAAAQALGTLAAGNALTGAAPLVSCLAAPAPAVKAQSGTAVRRSYHSREQESSPVQTTGSGLPPGADKIAWKRPSAWTTVGAFSGRPGAKASHEGVDYVHAGWNVPHVPVCAAADGKVIYVRTGAPATDMRSRNKELRECGAGWGNHVVIEHGYGIRTRYAHLTPDSIIVGVGDVVKAGTIIGENGNSGRSELRHLHFELGTGGKFDPKRPAASFDKVYDSGRVPWNPKDKGPSSAGKPPAPSPGAAPGSLPAPDAKGDYSARTTHSKWVVKDSSGLNGRLSPAFPSNGGAEWPKEMNIDTWPVVTTFPTGTMLTGVMGNMGVNIARDIHGDTWMMVKNGDTFCFVRASDKYINPR